MDGDGWTTRVMRRLWREDDATTTVEYTVMLALIVLVALAAITLLGTGVRDTFSNGASEMPSGEPTP